MPPICRLVRLAAMGGWLLAACAWPAAAAAATASLDFEIVDAIGWSGDANRLTSATAPAIPPVQARKVVETYSYDAAADELTIDFRFDRKGFCPMPPMLALAADQGFPIQFDPKPVDTGHVCAIGPLWGVKDADGFRCRIRGLGRYVAPQAPPGAGRAPQELLDALHAEVKKVIDAPMPLRPWLVLVNVPGSGADNRGDVYWSNPAETLFHVAEAAPFLEGSARQALTKYLREFRTTFPPEKVRSLKFAEGAPREAFPPPEALAEQWAKKVLAYRVQGPPPIWSLYGLARYYELAGERPDAETMAACGAIVDATMAGRDWATLYFRRGRTPEFDAVHAVNQLFAGFVGYVRLARLAGDAKAEALAWGLLGRAAALRFAMGKYTQFQHARGMFNVSYRVRQEADHPIRVESDPKVHGIPKDPAWWVKADGMEWQGNLRTWRWSSPADNVRQVARLDETGVDVWEYGTVDCGGTGQKRKADAKDYWYGRLAPYYVPFADLTPELGRFLADHLKPECAAYIARVEENQPHWHIAYSEAILSGENSFMTPPNAHGLLLAKAWVLGATPAELEKRIDVPWLPRGDLFYIHKLAATIRAFRAAVAAP